MLGIAVIYSHHHSNRESQNHGHLEPSGNSTHLVQSLRLKQKQKNQSTQHQLLLRKPSYPCTCMFFVWNVCCFQQDWPECPFGWLILRLISNVKPCPALLGTKEDYLTDASRASLPEKNVPGRWGVDMFTPGLTVRIHLTKSSDCHLVIWCSLCQQTNRQRKELLCWWG